MHFRVLDMRTSQHYAQHYALAANLSEDETLRGFKSGRMPFPPLVPRLPFSCPIDIMHLAYLGTMRYLLQSIVKNHERFGPTVLREQNRIQVDNLLARIKWPTSISRKVRPLVDLADYKAQEYRSFCLIVPILVGYVNDADVMAMLLLYSHALILLNREVLYDADIDRAEEMLRVFHLCLRSVFGPGSLRANAHGLQHLAQQARRYGPLYTQSAFSFEGHIGNIVRLVSGTKGYLSQYLNRFSLKVQVLGAVGEKEDVCVSKIVHHMLCTLLHLVNW